MVGLFSLRPPSPGLLTGKALVVLTLHLRWGRHIGGNAWRRVGGGGSLAAHSAPPSGPAFSKVSQMTAHCLCCISFKVHGTVSHPAIKTHSPADPCPCPESNPQPGLVGPATSEPLTASLMALEQSRPSARLVSRKATMVPIFPLCSNMELQSSGARLLNQHQGI